MTPEQIQNEIALTRATLPIAPLLSELFVKPEMFASLKTFEKARFKTIDHSPIKVMAGSHKRAPGYLFKKYNDDRSDEEQVKNYMRRIEGARLLRTFIVERGFQSVTVPQKWLYELPASFPRRYLLVVEKLDLASDTKTKKKYEKIDGAQLRELATTLFYFRGLNSTASNLPFTKDGKIALIDTERWHHDKEFFRKIRKYLTADNFELTMSVFNELSQQGARPFQSQLE